MKYMALAWCFILLPEVAYAYNLVCMGGLPIGGEVFLGVSDCSAFGMDQPFSGLNCYFQQILNEVIKRIYCGIQWQLGPFLQILILLFVIIYAIMFTFGFAALTAKELVIRLIKIALIWAFAMNASWGIGLAFYFLVGGIETVVTWVVQILFPGMQGQSFIGYIDYLIFNQLTGGLTTDGFAIIGFFATLLVLMFPVFLLFLIYMMTVLAALTRTVVSYLLGLSAIAFLIALGPIFISMALFKSTFTFFDSWFRYLISFTMQIIFIFAAVALWLFVMQLFGDFFVQLANYIVPYNDRTHSQASFAFFKNTWGICLSGGVRDPNTGVMTSQCISGQIMPPSAYSNHASFMSWIVFNLLALGTVVYAFDALLRMIPNFARQLAGPAFAPQLGGGAGFGAVEMPGFSMIGRGKERLFYQAKLGGLRALGGLQRTMGSALGFGSASSGRQTAAEEGRDTVAGIVGNRRT